MRRRRLLAGGLGALGSLAGCTALAADPGRIRPRALEWDLRSTDGGELVVEDGVEFVLRFRVYRCNTALARASLGSVQGTLEVAFDWRIDPEEWYESTVVGVRVDGQRRAVEGPQIDKEAVPSRPGTSRGRFHWTVKRAWFWVSNRLTTVGTATTATPTSPSGTSRCRSLAIGSHFHRGPPGDRIRWA